MLFQNPAFSRVLSIQKNHALMGDRKIESCCDGNNNPERNMQ